MLTGLVAILRGVAPAEAVAVATTVIDAGFPAVEVPLNSPAPLDSIARIAEALSGRAAIGAGTVRTPAEVAAAAGAGASFIVSPHCDRETIRATRDLGLASLPGVFTASECFAALAAGASGLKLFPAGILGPAGVAALRAVLPPTTRLVAVGGVDPTAFAAWRRAGIDGFGIGAWLYVPGRPLPELRQRAERCVAALDACRPEAAAVPTEGER